MKKQSVLLLILTVWLSVALPGKLAPGAAGQSPQRGSAAPRIQLAILLDTSGSMDGLIDQAKSRLWKIVNELAAARKHGRAPRLQVALYEYGQNSIPAAAGYPAPHRAPERRPRPHLRRTVQAEDQRRRRILRPGHPRARCAAWSGAAATAT